MNNTNTIEKYLSSINNDSIITTKEDFFTINSKEYSVKSIKTPDTAQITIRENSNRIASVYYFKGIKFENTNEELINEYLRTKLTVI